MNDNDKEFYRAMERHIPARYHGKARDRFIAHALQGHRNWKKLQTDGWLNITFEQLLTALEETAVLAFELGGEECLQFYLNIIAEQVDVIEDRWPEVQDMRATVENLVRLRCGDK